MTAGVSTMNSSSTSTKTTLAKLVSYPKPRTFKVMVLGQPGVGKSALVVRFITRKFIGEYDPNLEKIYPFQTVIDNETVWFEILDSAGVSQEMAYANLEHNIRWAEAFILMYSVTDKCSFDECHRLKFLINYNKRRRRLNSYMRDNRIETPVVMVGNKIDQIGDRMISTEEGQHRSKDIGCVCFHEISVRESIEQVWGVFSDVCRFWRVGSKWTRHDGDRHPSVLHLTHSHSPTSALPMAPQLCRRYTEELLDEEEELEVSTSSSSQSDSGNPFRARASTDSRLPPHPTRVRHPPPKPFSQPPARRMSVAMKGHNSSTF